MQTAAADKFESMIAAQNFTAQTEAYKEVSRQMQTEKQDLRSELEKRVDEIIAAGEPWTDPDFGPVPKSLVDPKNDS